MIIGFIEISFIEINLKQFRLYLMLKLTESWLKFFLFFFFACLIVFIILWAENLIIKIRIIIAWFSHIMNCREWEIVNFKNELILFTHELQAFQTWLNFWIFHRCKSLTNENKHRFFKALIIMLCRNSRTQKVAIKLIYPKHLFWIYCWQVDHLDCLQEEKLSSFEEDSPVFYLLWYSDDLWYHIKIFSINKGIKV